MVEELTDDIEGSKADGTLAFSYDGTNYEIELNKRNRTAFDKAIAPYVAAARKVRATGSGAPVSPRARRSRGDRRTDLAEIRAWAAENGHNVSDRGRIAAEIVEAYDAAH